MTHEGLDDSEAQEEEFGRRKKAEEMQKVSRGAREEFCQGGKREVEGERERVEVY